MKAANDNGWTPGQSIEIDDAPPGIPTTYVVAFGLHVKIGTSSQIERRLVQLQNSVPEYLYFCALFYGGERVEAALHRRFAAQRTPYGEWFHYAGDIEEWLLAGCPDEVVIEAIKQRAAA